MFWAAALFTLVMAVLSHPPRLPIETGDKVQHIVAFATLAVLGTWAYSRTSTITILVGLSLFGAFIELCQAIPMIHRDSDVRDWLADTIAAGLVLLAIRLWLGRKKTSP